MSLLKKTLSCFGFSSSSNDGFSSSSKDERRPRSTMDNLNLGIGLIGGVMSVIIPANTNIPRKEEKIFSLTDFKSCTCIRVYEGQSSNSWKNFLLGWFNLNEILPAPRGVAKFKICFDIDANGTLKVSAVDMISSKLKEEIKITRYAARSFKRKNAYNTLKNYVNGIKRSLAYFDGSYKGKMKAEDQKKITEAANDAIEWLNKNQSPKLHEYIDKKKELEALYNPIVTKIYQVAVSGPSPPPKEVVEPELCCPPKASSKFEDVD